MLPADRPGNPHAGQPPSHSALGNHCGRLRRLFTALPVAAALATLGGTGSAAGPGCAADLATCQGLDQENLLAYFNTLPGIAGGSALLGANMRTEEAIYLGASQSEKIAAGTVFIIPLLPANILLRAFPGDARFHYDAASLPIAPPLPPTVAAAVAAVAGNNQVAFTKPFFGSTNVYFQAYGLLPGQIDSTGNPPPYQSSAAIHGNPFTPENSSPLAYHFQQQSNAFTVNWQGQQPGSDSQIGDYPSAHTMAATINAITYAILAPGYYQQLAQSVERFTYDLNVFGEHYPLDVVGGRILGLYLLAQTLSGNPLYPYSPTIPASLAVMSQDMQSYLGGGGSSIYAGQCAGNVAGCVAGGVIPPAATFARQIQTYTNDLTYGLPSIGDTTRPPVVPQGASVLIATRFPYLNPAQLAEVLYTTELPSGVPLDDGSGWARLNLYAAASGYGAFRSDVTVSMTAALGGLNAFDVWSNNISGPGGLTLQGSGTLILAGNNTYTGATTVQGGTLAVTGSLAGDVAVWPGARFAGSGAIAGSLALLPGSAYLAAVGPDSANLIQAGGTATLTGATLVVSSIGGGPPLGAVYPILTAAGGVSGSFASLTEPASGLAAGTRLDTLYGGNAVSLAVTPSRYADLAAAGVAQSSSESAVGAALDAIRPPPGTALDPAHAALFDPLYALPAAGITVALDELAPSIYADTMITARNAWYLMGDAVSGQLAARRGLAADHAADSAPGPNGSTIWVSGLAGYDGIGTGGGSPGFTAALGGVAAGIDAPVLGNGRLGVAIGTVDGKTWSHSAGNATNSTAQAVIYGQWQSGMWFAESQLGLMYQQETAHRSLPLFAAATQGGSNGLAAGGGVRVGVQRALGAWLVEPSLGFGGFHLRMDGLAETGSGALAETIGGATLTSAESTLAVSAQRDFALSETTRVTVKGRLGWAHEFADNTARIAASFAGLSGSGFALNSAPIGRDAAVIGVGADVRVAAWPLAMFVGYGGAISGSSSAQSFNAGVRFAW